MAKRHYCDYFYVPEDYKANMTAEVINKTPEYWMDFYPHKSYMEFLSAIFESIKGTSKTVWLAGNYGTGKSSAALVTQKLFMDDFSRVDSWFSDNKLKESYPEIFDDLKNCREENTIVIYDYNASGLGPNEEFIVRIEKTIIKNLADQYTIPAEANIDKITQRIREEGDRFFATRDTIKDKLQYLPLDINDIERVVDLLKKEDEDNSHGKILSDVQKILHEKSIFLDANVETFREWYKKILKINNIRRIIYIFDEFSDFLDANKTQLKTFEDVAECVSSEFYLIPVTHLNLNAYRSDKSQSAKRSKDRFFERRLEMPPDTALKLAAHAMKVYPEMEEEWNKDKGTLWNEITSVVDCFEESSISRESFRNILPIHPMAGFLLKYLSENAGSNQRSVFEYLKGGANGHEFQDFIKEGGTTVIGKQFLTVDYLWKYFIERDDLGQSNDVKDIRTYYNKSIQTELRGIDENDKRIRIFKAVLLYVLLSYLNIDGHERLQPTVENIKLSFRGDKSITDVMPIVEELQQNHCFSIMNGNISLYATTDNASIKEEAEKYRDKFYELICKKTEERMRDYIKPYCNENSTDRFDVWVSDAKNTHGGVISATARERFGSDHGYIRLWFVIAKDKDDIPTINEKVESLLNQYKSDYKFLLFTFDNTSFCDNNKDAWEEYTRAYAKYSLEMDGTIKAQFKNDLEKSIDDWMKILKDCNSFTYHCWKDDETCSEKCDWQSFKSVITNYVHTCLPYNIDYLSPQQGSATAGLQTAAKAGINPSEAKNQYKQFVDKLKKSGVTWEEDWFDKNPTHPFTEIHKLLKKKIDNTLGRGSNFNVRKAYIDLMKVPFGLSGNTFTAFTLGFCLKDLLKNNYQDTDERVPRPLNEDGLASMIESALKNGTEKPKSERTICKITKEDKAFIAQAPLIFGLKSADDSTVINTINSISNRIVQSSDRIPIWVLTPYIAKKGDPNITNIKLFIDNLCTAIKSSSKNNEERSRSVTEIGTLLLKNPSFVNSVKPYFETEVIKAAFDDYISTNYPDMKTLSEDVGDSSKKYIQNILNKASATSSYLWEKNNLDENVRDTIAEYRFIKEMKSTLYNGDFGSYHVLIESLQYAVFDRNKIPGEIIEKSYPKLSAVIKKIPEFTKNQNADRVKEFTDEVKDCDDTIKMLFFDDELTLPANILKSKVDTYGLNDEDLKGIIRNINTNIHSTEQDFIASGKSMVHDVLKKSVISNIRKKWKELSECDTLDEWASKYHLPAKYAFEEENRERLYDSLRSPESYSTEVLNEVLDTLNNYLEIDPREAQQRFLKDNVPTKYAPLQITFGGLADYLKETYGDRPNRWGKIDISNYVKKHYTTEFAPLVIKDLKKQDAESLKKKIMELAETNEDIGMLFLEK